MTSPPPPAVLYVAAAVAEHVVDLLTTKLPEVTIRRLDAVRRTGDFFDPSKCVSRPLYVASSYPDEVDSLLKKLSGVPGLETRCLHSVRLTETVFDPSQFVVAELESGDLAGKIEYLYADLASIIKYRHKLCNLKWAHSTSNGIDAWYRYVDPTEPLPKFTLTRTSGSANSTWIAEYVIGHILAREKSILECYDAQRDSKWKQTVVSRNRGLSKLSIGILGAGVIGKEVAKLCKAFGMTVWGVTRRPVTPDTTAPDVDVYRTTEDLPEVLENCDYICSILPSTPATRGLLSGDVLSHCQHKKSIVINVGRGDVLDEESIVRAVQSGWIGGAVLDVFPEEPLPESSPLWSLPGVTITPHISGWSLDPSFLDDLTQCFADNYKRFQEGQPLQQVVDWDQGY